MVKWGQVLLVLIVAIAAFLALTWGIYYQWPDYVHVDYGIPLTWATHTLSTILGPPAAPWGVDVASLQVDLAFWLILIIVAVIAGRKLEKLRSG